MRYLDRLKKSEKVGQDYPKEPKEFKKTNCLGLLGTLPVTYQKLQATETTSPNAITVEPFAEQTKANPPTSCDTCAHVTGRGGCGEPVAAGLSNVAGVIVYHDTGGKDCSAWLAIIPTDLEARILAMAERWNYSGDDLAVALAGARADPAGWRKVLESPCE